MSGISSATQGKTDGQGGPATAQALRPSPLKKFDLPILRAADPRATTHGCPAARPSSPRASSSLRAGWLWLARGLHRFEDSWAGDAFGTVCLFAIFWLLSFLVLIFE